MRIFVGAGLIAAFLFADGAPVLAHSFLLEATPSPKDHIVTAPKIVKLRFGGGVEPAYSTLSVQGADGKVVAEGAKGDPAKPRELNLDVTTPLMPGRCVVKYRVLSTDGHIVEGNYEFFVDRQ